MPEINWEGVSEYSFSEVLGMLTPLAGQVYQENLALVGPQIQVAGLESLYEMGSPLVGRSQVTGEIESLIGKTEIEAAKWYATPTEKMVREVQIGSGIDLLPLVAGLNRIEMKLDAALTLGAVSYIRGY